MWGTVDQAHIRTHDGRDDMRNSIGVYAQAGFPGYFDHNQDGFPDNFVSRSLTPSAYSCSFHSLQKSLWPPVRPMDRIISKLGRPPKGVLVNLLSRMNTVTMSPTRRMRQERMEVRFKLGAKRERDSSVSLAGLPWSGNLPHDQEQGVHSMSDVFIYSHGKNTHIDTLSKCLLYPFRSWF